jgi:hypothetical protein
MSYSNPASIDISQKGKEEILITDAQYIIREYRILLNILEAVKLFAIPPIQIENALDVFIDYKLPSKYSSRLPDRAMLYSQFSERTRQEVRRINRKYDSDEDRAIAKKRLDNLVRIAVAERVISEIKKILEDEGIMNNFEPLVKEGLGAPLKVI